MSILSTDKKLISFGTEYSAGSGISIIDHTISIVPSAVGKVYSAGPNIGIYDVSGQPTISSKDWTQDIDQSSSGAVTESISYFHDWINGQYTEDISNVTNNITALSGDLSSFYKKTETSSKEQINDALQYVSAHAVGDVEVNNYVHNNSATIDEVNSAYQSNSANYLTAVNIPESATWNETSNVVSSNSAKWSEGKTYEGISPIVVNNHENKVSADTWTLSAGNNVSFVDDNVNKITRIDVTAQGGDEGVNLFVTENSASIIDVNNSYKANSSVWNDTSNVVQTNSAQWAEGGGGGSVSSKYGTITVDGSDIEATNKAIEFKSHGFTSSFDYISLDGEHNPTATFTWDNYSQDTTLITTIMNMEDSDALTYSSNTNVTGLITAPQYTPTGVSLSLPNATAVQFSANHRYDLNYILVTAASSFQVSELAWKSDLPTYSYDKNHKISAINGSHLVGNENYLVQQGFVQNLRSPKGTISLLNNNKIEGTNSAIASNVIEGFVSSYNVSVYPRSSATLTWERYVPNAMLYISGRDYYQDNTLTYSANTNETGTITVPTDGQVSVELPTDSTSIVIGNENEDWGNINYNFTVSADNYYEIGELAWASALPTYENTEGGLVSSIGSSGLYSISAGTATDTNGVLDNGTLGGNLTWSSTGHKMVLNPTRTQFGITSGIYNNLTYATGACISCGSYSGPTSNKQWFGGYFKGNEWMISNARFGGAMLAGFKSDNVYLSGVRTNGDDFNLCQYSVSGKNSKGSWKYGNEEDTLLRTLSSQIAYLSGVIAQYHS